MNCTGIPNIGNTCYLNSALQLLVSCQILTNHYMQKDNHIFQIFLKRYKLGNIDGSFMMMFKKALTTNPEMSMFSNFSQHDSHEFILRFFEFLEKSGDNKDKKLLKILFENSIESVVQCKDCRTFSRKSEPLNILSYDIVGGGKRLESLEDCLLHESRNIHLTGLNQYECNVCSVKTDAIRQYNNEIKSKYLLLHLKRVVYSENRILKVNHMVKMPQVIYNHYYLRGFIHHNGHADGGHYVAYIRTTKGHWNMISDTSIRTIENVTILRNRGVLYLYVRNSKISPPKS